MHKLTHKYPASQMTGGQFPHLRAKPFLRSIRDNNHEKQTALQEIFTISLCGRCGAVVGDDNLFTSQRVCLRNDGLALHFHLALEEVVRTSLEVQNKL